MSDEVIDLRSGRRNGQDAVPAVTDLGLFRGRATTEGVPVLPPPVTDRSDAELDLLSTPMTEETAALPAPRPPWLPEHASAVPARVLERQPQAGPEVRVIRRVRPWSIARLAFVFTLCLVVISASAAAILWLVARSAGLVSDVETFVESLGFERFRFDGPTLLRAVVTGGLIVSVAAAVMGAILAVLFNLLTDLTGGVEAVFEPPRPTVRDRIRARRARRARRA